MRGQALGRLLDVGLPEAVGLVVGRLAHHPRVDVAEELHPLRAEDLGRRVRSRRSRRCHSGSSSPEHTRSDLAVLAPRGDHQHDPVAGVGRSLAIDAAGGDRLVVGVGVEADERGHDGAARVGQAIAPEARSLATSSTSKPHSVRTSSVCWPACAGGALDARRGAAEARRRRRLADAGDLDEGGAGHVVGMLRRLGHGQDGGEAHVGALHAARTTRPRVLVRKIVGQPLLQLGPAGLVLLGRQVVLAARGPTARSSSA